MTKMITGLAEISATPAGGNVTTYEYDSMNRLTKLENDDSIFVRILPYIK